MKIHFCLIYRAKSSLSSLLVHFCIQFSNQVLNVRENTLNSFKCWYFVVRRDIFVYQTVNILPRYLTNESIVLLNMWYKLKKVNRDKENGIK